MKRGTEPSEVEKLRTALAVIADWRLPATGKFWDEEKTRPTSYETEYGSNGARDYMRKVAQHALAESAPSEKHAPWCHVATAKCICHAETVPHAPARQDCTCCGCGGCKQCLGGIRRCPKHGRASMQAEAPARVPVAQVVAVDPPGPDGHGVNWLKGKRSKPGALLYAEPHAALATFRALLRAEVSASIDVSGDIARQEAQIDEADHLLVKFNELFPEAS